MEIVVGKEDRKLSIFELFEVLQVEYLVIELRSKIYPSAKDKEYFKEIMVKKKKSILEIAKRNNLRTIFDDPYYLDFGVRVKVFPVEGPPIFRYKNEEMKKRFHQRDLLYYFYPGTEVSTQGLGGGKVVAKIISYIPGDDFVVVKSDDSEFSYKVSVDKTSRIL